MLGLSDLKVSAELIRQVEILEGIEAVKALVIRTAEGDVEIVRGAQLISSGSEDCALDDDERHGFFVDYREQPLKHRVGDVFLPKNLVEALRGIDHPAIVGLRLEIAEKLEAVISARKGLYPKGILAEEGGVVEHGYYDLDMSRTLRHADILDIFGALNLKADDFEISGIDGGFRLMSTIRDDIDLPVFSRDFANGFDLEDMARVEDAIDVVNFDEPEEGLNDRDAFALLIFNRFRSHLIPNPKREREFTNRIDAWIKQEYKQSLPYEPGEYCYVKKEDGKTLLIWDFKITKGSGKGPVEEEVEDFDVMA